MNPRVATKEFPSWYRWVMLGMFSLISFFISVCQFQPSFFAQDIMAEFGVTPQGFSLITAFPMMTGLVLALLIGTASDKFGIRKTILLALVVTAVGALARTWCVDYVPLLLTSAILGIAATMVSANLAKLAMLWFPPRQVALAVGISSAMGSAGMAFAQAVTGIMFADFRASFFWGGVTIAVMAVLWLIFGRDKGTDPSSDPVPTTKDDEPVEPVKKKGLKDVITSKGVWLAGATGALCSGFNVTAGSLLITALAVYWGTDLVLAGVIAALFTIGAMVGCVVLPGILVRVRWAKIGCILLPVVSMALVFTAWNVDVTAVRCVLFPLAGFFFGGIGPVATSYPSILPEIDNNNSGAAGGMILTVNMLGAVVLPSLVITPIAGTDYNLMMILACIVCVLAVIPLSLLPSIYHGKE